MNKCDELKILIEEGYKLKASAYLAWFPNGFGQMIQLPVINEADLIKWNTKIDLFFQRVNSPIRNVKRNEFPNHNIVQYMDIKLKNMEALLENWKNEMAEAKISENIMLTPKTSKKKVKTSIKRQKAKNKNAKASNINNINIIQKILRISKSDSIIKKIIEIVLAAIVGGIAIYYTVIYNYNMKQEQNNEQQTIVNVNIKQEVNSK